MQVTVSTSNTMVRVSSGHHWGGGGGGGRQEGGNTACHVVADIMASDSEKKMWWEEQGTLVLVWPSHRSYKHMLLLSFNMGDSKSVDACAE